jgi:hypothetical protein
MRNYPKPIGTLNYISIGPQGIDGDCEGGYDMFIFFLSTVFLIIISNTYIVDNWKEH